MMATTTLQAKKIQGAFSVQQQTVHIENHMRHCL